MNGWRSGVGEAVVVGAFYGVGIMAPAFDDSGECAVAAGRILSFEDLGECFGECLPVCVRGKNPPAL